MKNYVTLILGCTILLSGCSISTKLQTQKAADFNQSLNSFLILLDAPDYTKESQRYLQKSIFSSFEEEGKKVQCKIYNPVGQHTLEDYKDLFDSSKLQGFLVIEQIQRNSRESLTSNNNNHFNPSTGIWTPLTVEYTRNQVTLHIKERENPVWRMTVDIRESGFDKITSKKFAEQLISKMREDKIM